MPLDLGIFSRHHKFFIGDHGLDIDNMWDLERADHFNCDRFHGPSTFYKDPDALAIGCSVTAGQAIPRSLTWPFIYQALSGKTVNICSRPAAGLDYLLPMAAQIIKQFGTPKKIMILSPNLERASVPSFAQKEEELYLVRRFAIWDASKNEYTFVTRGSAGTNIILNNEFKPTNITGKRYSIDKDLCVDESLRILNDFIKIVKKSTSEISITSWNFRTWQMIVEKQITYFEKLQWGTETENIGHGVSGGLGNPSSSSCGHKPANKTQKKYWIVASDGIHPGFHQHIHIAEHFLRKRILQDEIDNYE
jgi:hypothetical protein